VVAPAVALDDDALLSPEAVGFDERAADIDQDVELAGRNVVALERCAQQILELAARGVPRNPAPLSAGIPG
jgi:hypothetical protein